MSDIQQFCLLSNSTRDLGCAQLIQKALESKSIFVFGELLDVPSIIALQDKAEYVSAFHTLELFCFDNYQHYSKMRDRYLELNDIQIRKLKLLSLVSLASLHDKLFYDDLARELDLASTRELEDLIIEAINYELVSGTLNQKERYFRVRDFLSRDIRPDALPNLLATFEKWGARCTECQHELTRISRSILATKDQNAAENRKLRANVAQTKQSLKTTGPDADSGNSPSSSASSLLLNLPRRDVRARIEMMKPRMDSRFPDRR